MRVLLIVGRARVVHTQLAQRCVSALPVARPACAPQPLPEHVTKDLILAIARENAEMTIKVIRETSAKQKAEKLSDEQAAELAEYVHLVDSWPDSHHFVYLSRARTVCLSDPVSDLVVASALAQEGGAGVANGQFRKAQPVAGRHDRCDSQVRTISFSVASLHTFFLE